MGLKGIFSKITKSIKSAFKFGNIITMSIAFVFGSIFTKIIDGIFSRFAWYNNIKAKINDLISKITSVGGA